MRVNTDGMSDAGLDTWFENTDESDFDTDVGYSETYKGPSAMTITARVVRDGKWWVVEIPIKGNIERRAGPSPKRSSWPRIS